MSTITLVHFFDAASNERYAVNFIDCVASFIPEENWSAERVEKITDAVRGYLEQVWGDAATRFRLMAANTRQRR